MGYYFSQPQDLISHQELNFLLDSKNAEEEYKCLSANKGVTITKNIVFIPWRHMQHAGP